MSEPAVLASALNPDTRLGGTARLIVGFVIGALFVLLPMHYYQAGREAALRGAYDQPLATAPDTSHPALEPTSARGASKPFASRLTYELSRAPEERPIAPPKATPAVASAPAMRPIVPTASAAKAAAVPLPQPAAAPAVVPVPPAERFANARPISIVPPDPRDRAAEIEREGQKPEYREAPRAQLKPRIFEGREIELKAAAKEPATALAAAKSPPAKSQPAERAEVENERVVGVTPIKPPAKAERTVVAKAPASAAAAATASEDAQRPGTAPAAGTDVEGRLEATRGWLAGAPPTTHTIQLLGTNSEEQLKANLKSLAKTVDPTKLYVFRTKAQGKPSITVLYGAYADRQSAQQALEKLPASITANKPVLRTVNGIRTEIKQHNTDGG